MSIDEKRIKWGKQTVTDVLYQHEEKIELLDENIELIKKSMNLTNEVTKLKLGLLALENHLITEFNETLKIDFDKNPNLFENVIHYRNGLRFALDFIKNNLKEQEQENGN